jgi:hypothetical protein
VYLQVLLVKRALGTVTEHSIIALDVGGLWKEAFKVFYGQKVEVKNIK